MSASIRPDVRYFAIRHQPPGEWAYYRIAAERSSLDIGLHETESVIGEASTEAGAYALIDADKLRRLGPPAVGRWVPLAVA